MDATLFCEALTFCDCELGSSDDVFELLGRICVRAVMWRIPGWMPYASGNAPIQPALRAKSSAWRFPMRTRAILIKPYTRGWFVPQKAPVAFEPMAGMGDMVGAQLIVNLGLKGHTEAGKEDDGAWQVEALQALMEIFMDADKVDEILACDDAAALCACMARLCGGSQV